MAAKVTRTMMRTAQGLIDRVTFAQEGGGTAMLELWHQRRQEAIELVSHKHFPRDFYGDEAKPVKEHAQLVQLIGIDRGFFVRWLPTEAAAAEREGREYVMPKPTAPGWTRAGPDVANDDGTVVTPLRQAPCGIILLDTGDEARARLNIEPVEQLIDMQTVPATVGDEGELIDGHNVITLRKHGADEDAGEEIDLNNFDFDSEEWVSGGLTHDEAKARVEVERQARTFERELAEHRSSNQDVAHQGQEAEPLKLHIPEEFRDNPALQKSLNPDRPEPAPNVVGGLSLNQRRKLKEQELIASGMSSFAAMQQSKKEIR